MLISILPPRRWMRLIGTSVCTCGSTPTICRTFPAPSLVRRAVELCRAGRHLPPAGRLERALAQRCGNPGKRTGRRTGGGKAGRNLLPVPPGILAQPSQRALELPRLNLFAQGLDGGLRSGAEGYVHAGGAGGNCARISGKGSGQCGRKPCGYEHPSV